MSDTIETFEVAGLNKLLLALKATKMPKVRVGILGAAASKPHEKGGTNYEVGLAHEFGSPKRKLPARSFLRIPLADKLNKELETSNLLTKERMAEVLKQGSIVPWLSQVAIVAERIVRGAFDTQGYGRWPGWKNPGYKNLSMQVLKDTGQLQESITSEVK